MLALEWWCFEVLALLSGYISVAALAAHVALYNLLAFIFMIPYGLGSAVGPLCGNALGEGKPKTAKKLCIVTQGMTTVATALMIGVLIYYRDFVISLYTDQVDVTEQMRGCWIPFIMMIFFDQ